MVITICNLMRYCNQHDYSKDEHPLPYKWWRRSWSVHLCIQIDQLVKDGEGIHEKKILKTGVVGQQAQGINSTQWYSNCCTVRRSTRPHSNAQDKIVFINSTMCLHTVQVNNQMSNLRQVLWCLAIQGYSNGWHWFHTLIDEWPAPHPIFVHIDLWRSIVYDFGWCVKLRWLSVRMLHITSSGILFTSSDSA